MEDELYESIKEYIKTIEYVSVAKIQSHFEIGFSRAGMLFNQLILDGLVEEACGSRGAKSLLYIPSPGKKEPRLGNDVSEEFMKFTDPFLNALLVVNKFDYVSIKMLCELNHINPNSAEAMMMLLLRDGYIEPCETPNRGFKVIKKPQF